MTTTNTYGRQVVVPLTNKSGGGVVAGDVVIVDTTNNDAFTTTTSAGSTASIGVVQETIASNATGRVLLSGYAALVNVNASVTRGNYGKTHTVAKQATDAGASRTAGTFCQFLTGGTTPDAVVYPSDLGSGSGTGTLTTIKDEGSNLSTAVVSLDFVGAGVTATGTTAVTATIPGLPIAIADSLLGGDTATFDFTSISGSYRHLEIRLSVRGTDTATNTWVKMTFNNDTAGNYDGFATQFFSGYTNAAVNEDLGATSFAHSFYMPAASSQTGDAGVGIIRVPDYASTTFNKGFDANCYLRLTTASTNVRSVISGGNWRSTAAITRITLTPTTGNFKAGSRATLYAFN